MKYLTIKKTENGYIFFPKIKDIVAIEECANFVYIIKDNQTCYKMNGKLLMKDEDNSYSFYVSGKKILELKKINISTISVELFIKENVEKDILEDIEIREATNTKIDKRIYKIQQIMDKDEKIYEYHHVSDLSQSFLFLGTMNSTISKYENIFSKEEIDDLTGSYLFLKSDIVISRANGYIGRKTLKNVWVPALKYPPMSHKHVQLACILKNKVFDTVFAYYKNGYWYDTLSNCQLTNIIPLYWKNTANEEDFENLENFIAGRELQFKIYIERDEMYSVSGKKVNGQYYFHMFDKNEQDFYISAEEINVKECKTIERLFF